MAIGQMQYVHARLSQCVFDFDFVCGSLGETETRGVSKVSTGSQGQTATDTRRRQQVQRKHDGEWCYGATPEADDESECWADVNVNVRSVHSQLDSWQAGRQRHNAAARTRGIRPCRERPYVHTGSRESRGFEGPRASVIWCETHVRLATT
jgi:hypothetical protein